MRAMLALALFCGCGFQTGASVDGAPSTGDGPVNDGPMGDARASDAPADAPPVLTIVETLTISCLGATVTSATTLQANVTYHLRASGECIANTANNSKADAEYLGYNVGPTYDSFGGVDDGIAVNDNTSGATKQPRWGAFTSTHIYEVPWTGAAATIAVNYHGDNLTNNAGSLTFQILAFQ